MVFKKFAKKQVGKAVRTGRKYVKKRYVKRTTGAVKTGQIARDVMMLKRLINTEKKFSTINSGLQTIGQVDGNSTGAYCAYIQPSLVRGTGADSAYTGNSVKLVSAYMQFQIQQQINQQSPTEHLFQIWYIPGQAETNTNTTLANIFEPAVFSATIDMYSPRVQNEFADYKLIKSFKVKFSMDQYSSNLAASTQLKTVQIPLKLNHHLRFNSDNSIASGQLVLTVLSNSGNRSNATASILTGIPQSGILTGSEIRYALKYYYVDN